MFVMLSSVVQIILCSLRFFPLITKVIFTYDVEWQLDSDTPWSNRWGAYLSGNPEVRCVYPDVFDMFRVSLRTVGTSRTFYEVRSTSYFLCMRMMQQHSREFQRPKRCLEGELEGGDVCSRVGAPTAVVEHLWGQRQTYLIRFFALCLDRFTLRSSINV